MARPLAAAPGRSGLTKALASAPGPAAGTLRHLFVTNDFPPKAGGIESYLLALASGFPPQRVTVVAPAREGHEEVDRSLPYRVVRLPGTYLRPTRSVAHGVVAAAAEARADVVHFLHALPLGRLAGSVREASGLAVTVFAHGSEVLVPARAPLVRRMLRRVLGGADLVLAVSEFTRRAVEEVTGGRARVELLPPAVDCERFSLAVSGAEVRHRLGLGGRFVVLFVGRLVRRKGAETLLRALVGVRGAMAVVVGKGPEEAPLRRLAEELELERRVRFVGFVPDAELPSYYAAADVFCMPCSGRFGGLDTEGFGIVYLEAAASGLPCVAGACGGSAEAVVDGVTGIVLEDPSPGDLASALRRLQSDEVLRLRMGAAGRRRVEERFRPPLLAQRLEGYVAELVGRRAP